jgi:hypothetical protein
VGSTGAVYAVPYAVVNPVAASTSASVYEVPVAANPQCSLSNGLVYEVPVASNQKYGQNRLVLDSEGYITSRDAVDSNRPVYSRAISGPMPVPEADYSMLFPGFEGCDSDL